MSVYVTDSTNVLSSSVPFEVEKKNIRMTFVETFDLTETGKIIRSYTPDFTPRAHQPFNPVAIKVEDETVVAATPPRKSRIMAGLDDGNIQANGNSRESKGEAKRKIAAVSREIASSSKAGKFLYGEKAGYRKRKEIDPNSTLGHFLLGSFTNVAQNTLDGVLYRVAKHKETLPLYGLIMDEEQNLYQVCESRVFVVDDDCNNQVSYHGAKYTRGSLFVHTFVL